MKTKNQIITTTLRALIYLSIEYALAPELLKSTALFFAVYIIYLKLKKENIILIKTAITTKNIETRTQSLKQLQICDKELIKEQKKILLLDLGTVLAWGLMLLEITKLIPDTLITMAIVISLTSIEAIVHALLNHNPKTPQESGFFGIIVGSAMFFIAFVLIFGILTLIAIPINKLFSVPIASTAIVFFIVFTFICTTRTFQTMIKKITKLRKEHDITTTI